MLKGQNIICISSADWDNPYWTNQQHIMWRLAKDNKVLYVESLGLRRPVIQKKDLMRMYKRLRKWITGIRKIDRNLYVYSPVLIPFYKYDFIRRINHWVLVKSLQKAIKKFGLKNPILWGYVPNTVDFLGKLNEVLVVYHCVDEISANPLIPGKIVLEMEKELLKKSAIVFVSSRGLYESKKKFARNIYYLPNVADIAHILKANLLETRVPGDMAGLKHPIIGFIGAVSNYKIDFEILEYMTNTHPDWSIVLIGVLGEGEKQARISEFRKYKNLYLLGGRDYSLLPNYLKAFDICILPNRINDYTKNMFPMKFFEYLAAGKPVVATCLEALEDFKDYIKMAKTKEEFVGKIEESLSQDTKEERKRRIELSKKYSWDERIEEISQIISRQLKEQ